MLSSDVSCPSHSGCTSSEEDSDAETIVQSGQSDSSDISDMEVAGDEPATSRNATDEGEFIFQSRKRHRASPRQEGPANIIPLSNRFDGIEKASAEDVSGPATIVPRFNLMVVRPEPVRRQPITPRGRAAQQIAADAAATASKNAATTVGTTNNTTATVTAPSGTSNSASTGAVKSSAPAKGQKAKAPAKGPNNNSRTKPPTPATVGKITVPLIYVKPGLDTQLLMNAIKECGLGNDYVITMRRGGKFCIRCETLPTQKGILAILQDSNASGHSYTPPSEKSDNILLRGIPATFGAALIQEELRLTTGIN